MAKTLSKTRAYALSLWGCVYAPIRWVGRGAARVQGRFTAWLWRLYIASF